MLETKILPLIVNFLRLHWSKIFFIFGSFNLQLSLMTFCRSLELDSIPNSTKTFVHSSLLFFSLLSCCPLLHQAGPPLFSQYLPLVQRLHETTSVGLMVALLLSYLGGSQGFPRSNCTSGNWKFLSQNSISNFFP